MEYVKKILFIIVVVVILGAGYWFFQKRMAVSPQEAPGAMPAQFAEPEIRDYVRFDEYTGRVDSTESVDIRARISGYLQKINFIDGAFVKKGDLLFEIEPELYQADLDRAMADLKAAEADLNRAQQDFDRVQRAVQSDAVSQQDVTRYQADRDKAESKVMAAKSVIAKAKLNLSYTKIYSPIDGKISRRFVDVGNLVGADEMTLLARVVALDPIYVYFNVSEGDLLSYYQATSDIVTPREGTVMFQVSLANQTDLPFEGVLDYMDNTVDPMTGTIQVRGVVDNPARKILPGMFARIKVPAGESQDAVMVQEKAIGTDLGGKYLLVIGEGNIVEQRPITISSLVDGLRVVESGLAAGEKYIVTGTQFMQPGMPVMPIPEGQMLPMGPGGPGPEGQTQEGQPPQDDVQ